MASSAWKSEPDEMCSHCACPLSVPVHPVRLLPARRMTNSCLPERGAEECPNRLATLPVKAIKTVSVMQTRINSQERRTLFELHSIEPFSFPILAFYFLLHNPTSSTTKTAASVWQLLLKVQR